MSRPLYDALCSFAASAPLRMHMPGHKGRAGGLFSAVSTIDFTELSTTGNLYSSTGPIAKAEALCAAFGGADDALFLSCGSTQGIYAMLSAAANPGSKILLDRGCHKSVFQAMALLDLEPCYIDPEPAGNTSLSAPVSPDNLSVALNRNPDVSCVMLTAPTYYGLRTDVKALSRLCHAAGKPLLVDEAHGAHFPAIGLPTAAMSGADLSVVSTHKTWPALGSSAVLYLSRNSPFTRRDLKARCALFGTSSPSYPILASIDYARDALEGSAGDHYRAACAAANRLRETINYNTPLHAITETDWPLLDPCRLTVDTLCAGLDGFSAAACLEQAGIYVEMADLQYIVLILTSEDTPEDFLRLEAALCALAPVSCSTTALSFPYNPGLPPVRMRIRTAMLGPVETAVLSSAAGRISAQLIAPYPPGIPVIVPGEEITEKHIAYLNELRYNIDAGVYVVSKN